MTNSGDTGEGGVGGKRADLAGLKLFQLALEAHWPIPGDLVQANEAELRKILSDPQAGRRSKLAAMRVLESMRRANLDSIEMAIRAEERDSQAAERADLVELAEQERIRVEKSAAEDAALVLRLMDEGLSREQAEEFVAELYELGMAAKMKNWTLTDELKNLVLGWPVRPRLSAVRKDEIVHELLCRYGLAEPDEPEPVALPSPRGRTEDGRMRTEDELTSFLRPPSSVLLPPPPTPAGAQVPVIPGDWVDMGGEFYISIPD